MLRLFWIASVLSISLAAQVSAERPTDASISDLSVNPEKFDGHLVRVQAVLVFGWEGDNFLLDPSKPVPLSMPSRDPASVWFYCKPDREHQVFGAIEPQKVVYGSFEGYFHFVRETHIVNGAFEPGFLQFEATSASIPDPQPHSLATATLGEDVDEIRTILQSAPSIRQKYGSILLFLAARTDRADFVQELLSTGADAKFTMNDGSTSLMTAAWNCKLESAKALLLGGVPPNAASVQGETALIYASHTCPDGKMVQLLLDSGADAKAKCNQGALMAAAGNPRVVEKLLAAGADPTFKDKYGNTVENESCDRGEKGHYEVCQLVREALRKAAADADSRR